VPATSHAWPCSDGPCSGRNRSALFTVATVKLPVKQPALPRGRLVKRCVDRQLAQAGPEGTLRKPLEGRPAQDVRSNVKLTGVRQRAATGTECMRPGRRTLLRVRLSVELGCTGKQEDANRQFESSPS
jgi:hypothetical protein